MKTIEEAARTLVALWQCQNIAGLSRAERNAAVEGARKELTDAVLTQPDDVAGHAALARKFNGDWPFKRSSK